MKKTLFLVTALFVVSLMGNATQAFMIEMSTEQKEVWNHVEQVWEIMKKGDMEALEAGLFKEMAYWGYASGSPSDKNGYYDGINQWFAGRIKSYKLEPFAITISGNVGIAMYGWNMVMEYGRSISARSAMTYIKQNGKWIFLGGMACSCEKPTPCPF
jgi:hypothetical protein